MIHLSVCPSVCLSCWYTHRDSPWGSMRHGQFTFQPNSKEDQHTCSDLCNICCV